MGPSDSTLAQLIADARTRLRERTLPALTTALLLQISIATARKSYDLRALSSAFGLLVLIVLALLGATADAVLTFAVALLRDVTRVRVRFGPAAPAIVAPPPPITADMLLDKRGRPLRGAPRAKRIALLERERLALAAAAAATAAAAKPAFRVIELPPLPPRLVAAYARARALVLAAYARAIAAYRAAARGADRVGALVPSIPVPALPVRWIRIVSVTTTMTFVFATAIGTTGIIAQQGTIALGASTTLSIISGGVSARTADATDFRPLADGALLRAGMTIRTGDNAYAVLTYFEGSTVSIEPNTTLVIEALEANPDGSTVISMQQQVGRTWHSVTKLLNQGSKYEVKTPTLTATVRGTAFEVGVDQDAATGEIVSSVVTTEGAVGAAKPSTAAEPAPPEVIVPAGFQATAKAAEPVAPPEPAPEPERTVTVTVGTSNAVVVDPLGRANGEKDGKLVLQTPGAKVTKVDGKLVITLPKIPDGKISTVISPTTQPAGQAQVAPAPVSVVTVVSEKGKGEARSEETVQAPASASAPAVVTGVELKKSDSAQPAEVRVLNAAENKESKAPKLPEPPKPTEAPKPELLPAPEKKDEPGRSESREGAKVSSVVDVFVKATLPPLSVEDSARRAEEARKAEERAKEEAAKREEERRKENEQRAEEARKAEEKAKEEAAKRSEERRKAEEKAREETAKADVGRRAEQTARGGVDSPVETPAPANLVQNILKAIAPSGEDSANKKVDEARKAEEKAKEEVAKLGDERRKAEDTTRQDDIKQAEAARKAAEQRAEELKNAEEKAKQDAAKDRERVREIESKAREQAQKLEAEKRKEAERLIEEFRKAEEKTREEAAKRLEEQRKAEEKAKEDAEKRLEELRKAEEKAKEEAAKAEEERKREEQRKAEQKAKEEQKSGSNFLPAQTIDPLPGRLGSNNSGRGNSGR